MTDRLLMLAAYTARSQAYLQALSAAGISALTVLTYGAPAHVYETEKDDGRRASRTTQWRGVALPDLFEPIETTCQRSGWNVIHCPDRDIRSAGLHATLRACDASLVIFSGYGGQIVGAELLNTGAPFLHVHAGALPDYRGSTTIYYSTLERRECTASALLLRADIDTGPVLAQRTYPLPHRDMDVDRLYDSAIRADLLIHALRRLMQGGEAAASAQAPGDGHTYYVIHPVLKHLALLSLPRVECNESGINDTVSPDAA